MGLAELLCIGIILTTGKVNSFPAAGKVVFIVIFLIDVFISIIFSIPQSDSMGLVIIKRPFCNAFAGCGRKRSDQSMREEYSDLPLEAKILGTNIGTNEGNRRYQIQVCIDKMIRTQFFSSLTDLVFLNTYYQTE